jgi:hypothetical protein
MIAIGLLFVRMLRDYFKSRPQLEAEIVILRHQLNQFDGVRAWNDRRGSNAGQRPIRQKIA